MTVLHQARDINSRTHAWLGQFGKSTVGAAEAAQIERVLEETAQAMVSLSGHTSDARELAYLQETLRDMKQAAAVYHQMAHTVGTHQRERVDYHHQINATSNQQLMQTEASFAMRQSRALMLTTNPSAAQSPMMGMPTMGMAPTPVPTPPPSSRVAVSPPPPQPAAPKPSLQQLQPSAYRKDPPAMPPMSMTVRAWTIAYRVFVSRATP